MLSSPLPTVAIDPTGPARAVVIWLHGLGADGHDFEPIVPELHLPESLAVRFVFPHAPEIPVTAFGGQVARAWFDFDPGNRNGGLPGLDKSVYKVRDLVRAEIDNGVPERIVLAGFSQGGVVALKAGLGVGGWLAFSPYPLSCPPASRCLRRAAPMGTSPSSCATAPTIWCFP